VQKICERVGIVEIVEIVLAYYISDDYIRYVDARMKSLVSYPHVMII
jgi:hypothetical protein